MLLYYRTHTLLPAIVLLMTRDYKLKRLTSKYSSIPYLEPSLPSPDCFTPPNGATYLERSSQGPIQDIHSNCVSQIQDTYLCRN